VPLWPELACHHGYQTYQPQRTYCSQSNILPIMCSVSRGLNSSNQTLDQRVVAVQARSRAGRMVLTVTFSNRLILQTSRKRRGKWASIFENIVVSAGAHCGDRQLIANTAGNNAQTHRIRSGTVLAGADLRTRRPSTAGETIRIPVN